jgi:hypothetical protein
MTRFFTPLFCLWALTLGLLAGCGDGSTLVIVNVRGAVPVETTSLQVLPVLNGKAASKLERFSASTRQLGLKILQPQGKLTVAVGAFDDRPCLISYGEAQRALAGEVQVEMTVTLTERPDCWDLGIRLTGLAPEADGVTVSLSVEGKDYDLNGTASGTLGIYDPGDVDLVMPGDVQGRVRALVASFVHQGQQLCLIQSGEASATRTDQGGILLRVTLSRLANPVCS